MTNLKSICVYCGSGPGNDPAFAAAADEFGAILAREGIRLVYGGGSLGLMGRVARACMAAGGAVTGIIPQFLHDREVMLREVTELIVTEDMHQRKRLMFEHSDAFVTLPGGIGTLEEVVEMMTWSQLGQHEKPIVLANVQRFWDPLNALIGHMSALGFIRPGWEVSYDVVDRLEDIVPAIRARVPQLEADREPREEALSRL